MERLSYDCYTSMEARVHARKLPCGASLNLVKYRSGMTVYAVLVFASSITGEVEDIQVITTWLSTSRGIALWEEFQELTGINPQESFIPWDNRDDWK